MVTTPELRVQFNRSFSKIAKCLSPELQKKWDGIITWKDDHSYPDIDPLVIDGLSTAGKSAYVSLLNKLSRGKI